MLLGLGDDFTSFQNAAEECSRFDLSLMRTHLLDAVHEWVDASIECFERYGSYQVGSLDEAKSLEDGIHAIGTHELSSI